MSIERCILTINGVDREIVCNSEKDSLADVVRRLGLTGTKIGCGTGQCGACSLLLDGKVVRSCAKKMKQVSNYACVETIEGLGGAHHLHPLQQAFMTYASVQCGFCSPGFIMSALGLLRENPTPSRQEVRDWFTRHNNICRCTGYKPIVDAVMEAAAVMRGEKTMDDITYSLPVDGRVYGTHYPKPTALSRVLGTCDYGADVAGKMPAGSLALALVLAKTNRARIKSIEFAEAEAMPGVVKVITARDVKGTNRLFSPHGKIRNSSDCRERPIICADTVNRYGDVVAVVAAATREQARAAAEVVNVNYETLPAYMTYMAAAAEGAEQIHPNTPNVYLEQPVFKGDDTRNIFEQSACSVEGVFSTSRQPHLTVEPDVVQAYPQDGGVTIQCKTQNLYGTKTLMAEAIGLPKDRIRVILNPGGGSFGYSMSVATNALAAVCALATDAPVSLVLDYAEHQHVTGKRSPAFINARLACDAQGRFTGMEYHAGIDHGAYSDLAGALTSKVCRFFGYPYNIPNIRGLVQTAFTNNNFGIAFRAFGSPQAYTASEQLVDMLAARLGVDPFELRYRNVASEGDLCTNSVPYREYPMRAMMDMLRPHYKKALKTAQDNSSAAVKRGVGLAWGGYHVGKSPDHAEVDLELNPDSTVTQYCCWADVGQGADTGALLHAHEALRPLGLKPEHIRLVRNDTGTCPDTGSAAGSRSHHAAGLATLDAAAKLLAAMRKTDGSYRTWQEMQNAQIPTRYRGVFDADWADIDPNTGHGYGAVAQNYVLFMSEVAVEVATGKTTVCAATVIADVGKIGSYQAVLGQAWGGFSHSVGFALSEDYEDTKKHSTMRGAGVPRCNDIPDHFHIFFHETPREQGPHGSTGCAEGFQSAGHVSILNGIANAVNVRIPSLPATPQKLKAAMQAQVHGTPPDPTPWDLGCKLHERLAWLQENPLK